MAWMRTRDDDGTWRIVPVDPEADAEEQAEFRYEETRREQIALRRQYYDGEQWDETNRGRKVDCGLQPGDKLPEHERKHGYSTHITECVNFIADQLSDGFQVIPNSAAVTEALDAAWTATEQLTGGDDDNEPVTPDPLLVDAFQAGDVPFEARYDPETDSVWPEFWESEHVLFIAATATDVAKVIRDEWVWIDDPDTNDRKQVYEQVVYEVVPRSEGAGGDGVSEECRKTTYHDQETTPAYPVEWLGVPFIPWGLLRGVKKGLRAFRGEPLISVKAMDSSDRYDSVEQLGYVIARYNSHGNLAVIGDGATLKMKEEGGVHKDVADVLTFPGGTALEAITLPTDPQMIEHQRQVTSDAIYASFGLTRVEPDTLTGLGQVSGYALEILNRKSEGTFRRVRRQWTKDWLAMCGLLLDVLAYKRAAVNSEGESIGPVPDVDPLAVFPDRAIEIRLGSGYIVDDVAIRDDYTAGLISQREALRQRGHDEKKIDDIMDEIADEGQTEGSSPAPPPAAVEAGQENREPVGVSLIDDTDRESETA